MSLTRHRWVLLALALCALLYFVRLGDIAFLGKDEPKNAQAAREMLRAGDVIIVAGTYTMVTRARIDSGEDRLAA